MPKDRAAPKAAAIYARISEDRDGKSGGVKRQEKDCRELAKRRGWQVAEVFVDNDLSAYRGKPRPAYRRMLQAIGDGRVDGVLVWHLDRLTRHPRELEEFFETCDAARVRDMATVTGDVDLGTDDGRFHARILGAVARKSSDDMSRRISRKHAEIAAEGRSSGGGSRAFGYCADGVTVQEDEALEIKAAAERLLMGGSLRGICTDWNERGVTTSTGRQWRPWPLHRMIRSARIAGLREYDGAIVADATWPAIIDRATHERLRALLDAPGRYVSSTKRSYLLSGGLARCGLCGVALNGRPVSAKLRCYVCNKGPGFHGCGKIRVVAAPLEELVREWVIERYASPGFRQALSAAESEDDAAGDYRRLADLEAAADSLAVMLGSAQLSQRAYVAATTANEKEQAVVRARLAAQSGRSLLSEVPDTEKGLSEWWDAADLLERRALVASIVEKIVIAPAIKGLNRFDDRRVSVSWRDRPGSPSS